MENIKLLKVLSIERLLLRSFCQHHVDIIVDDNIIRICSTLSIDNGLYVLVEELLEENYDLWKDDVNQRVNFRIGVQLETLPDPKLRQFFEDLVSSEKTANIIVTNYCKDFEPKFHNNYGHIVDNSSNYFKSSSYYNCNNDLRKEIINDRYEESIDDSSYSENNLDDNNCCTCRDPDDVCQYCHEKGAYICTCSLGYICNDCKIDM